MTTQDILDRVHTRTYNIVESKKNEHPELAFVQTSPDNSDQLCDYLESATDRLRAYMENRLLKVDWTKEALVVTSSRENAEERTQRLYKAIMDYLVEELVSRWLSDVCPQLVDPKLAEERLDYVKDCVTALAPLVTRRPVGFI